MTEGFVDAIFIAHAGGKPMTRVDQILAEESKGLTGDRYRSRAGYWSGLDECQVTFIESEELEWIVKEFGLSVLNGEHRRNIVTREIYLFELRDARFTVGDAEFEYERPRPSCEYIETITEKGMAHALEGERGGICARVIKSGLIQVGDRINLIEK